jgi:hypothetical protein
MRRIRISKRWIILAAACSVSLTLVPPMRADAMADASIVANGTCATGATLYAVANANTTNGVIVNVTQTAVVSGKTTTNTINVTLAPSEQKNLGCAAPPGTNLQISWKVESAQYN